jgi:hypothetical protein
MHIMLAEDIGGWLVAGALMLGSIITSLLALGALYPAYRGMGILTVCLIAPAVVMALLVVYYFADAYVHREFHDQEEIMVNYIQPWLVMGLPPLATSLLSGGLLVFRKCSRFPDN